MKEDLEEYVHSLDITREEYDDWMAVDEHVTVATNH